MFVPGSARQCCCAYRYLRATSLLLLSVGRFLPITLCLLIFAIWLPPSLYAQSSRATLSGTVEDQKGALVPEASVTLLNVDQRSQRLATTNSEGVFIFTLLSPGRYAVTVTRDGFAPVEIKNLVLNVNDQVALRIHINVGTITQALEIVDATSLIDESPAVATLVDRQFIENLPLNGRSFQSLITLTPGVVLTRATASNAGQFSVNGQRADSNYFTIDGVSANISAGAGLVTGQGPGGALSGLSATGGTNNLVSVDALEEFKIQTSTYAPRSGRTHRAQVSMVTRSGTRDFQGSVFDYFRNDVLDAVDSFVDATLLLARATASAVKSSTPASTIWLSTDGMPGMLLDCWLSLTVCAVIFVRYGTPNPVAMLRDLFEFVLSHAKRLLVSFVITIATAADIMSFIPLPNWVLLAIRISGGAAALCVFIVLAYRFGKFQQARSTTEAERAVKECIRYLRMGPQPVDYDVGLVNRLTRAQYLRNHHGQWTIARLDADSQHLLLAGGADVGVIEGLIFSVLKIGNGIPCRCAVAAADISEDETRLRPDGFRIRAADQPTSFLIDLVDPTLIEVGRAFDVELLVAGTLSTLGAK